MKPGTSARNSSGRLNALQVQMKRAALSAESTNSTPPLTFGWLATIPIARPSRRAYPTTSSLRPAGCTSSHEPASQSASISSMMSNGLFWSAGTIVAMAGARRRARPAARSGGASRQFDGHVREVALGQVDARPRRRRRGSGRIPRPRCASSRRPSPRASPSRRSPSRPSAATPGTSRRCRRA